MTDTEMLAEVLRDTLRALEGSFPPGDESVGIQEFKGVDLSEAWEIRCLGRKILATYDARQAELKEPYQAQDGKWYRLLPLDPIDE